MFLIFSHTLTTSQKKDAFITYDIINFVKLPPKLQEIWSNIPADIEDVSTYLKPIKDFLKENIKEDVVLIQGDFGATYELASYVKSLGKVAIYSTTRRKTIEKKINNKTVKTSVFEHVKYRRF
jgi:hypothetical protein